IIRIQPKKKKKKMCGKIPFKYDNAKDGQHLMPGDNVGTLYDSHLESSEDGDDENEDEKIDNNREKHVPLIDSEQNNTRTSPDSCLNDMIREVDFLDWIDVTSNRDTMLHFQQLLVQSKHGSVVKIFTCGTRNKNIASNQKLHKLWFCCSWKLSESIMNSGFSTTTQKLTFTLTPFDAMLFLLFFVFFMFKKFATLNTRFFAFLVKNVKPHWNGLTRLFVCEVQLNDDEQECLKDRGSVSIQDCKTCVSLLHMIELNRT
ncbi:hypothetical protein RFI_26588, partial [Reticulomyxa filosa]